MNIQRVKVTRQPVRYFKYTPSIAKTLLVPFKVIPAFSGSVVAIILFLTLYFLGLPGILLSDGQYACNYQDLISTYGAAPTNNQCPAFKFRRFPIFPWQ